MCAIVGAVLGGKKLGLTYQAMLINTWNISHRRGRDGRGWEAIVKTMIREYIELKRYPTTCTSEVSEWPEMPVEEESVVAYTMLGNVRAEPTTEYVKDKSVEDQQPYRCGNWSIVHNGTIANDAAMRTYSIPTKIDSAAIAESLDKHEKTVGNYKVAFREMLRRIQGSYAILARHSSSRDLLAACNYRPIWYAVTEAGPIIASSPDSLPPGYPKQQMPPYTWGEFKTDGLHIYGVLYPVRKSPKALVVCSGGLDSVVAATECVRMYGHENVELLHLRYGSRAEEPEETAICAVAGYLNVKLNRKDVHQLYDKEDSNLLDPLSTVTGGEEGAEYAHEWVPARNLLMLAVAISFAEAKGFNLICLGNNLEEAGAYPDNEPEFINKVNALLPNAVGDGVRMQIIQPVGNMMKHEIVRLGHEIKAPMHLTWSCYRAGKMHCGKCGPCFMRRTAFKINNLPEVIEYDDENPGKHNGEH